MKKYTLILLAILGLISVVYSPSLFNMGYTSLSFLTAIIGGLSMGYPVYKYLVFRKYFDED